MEKKDLRQGIVLEAEKKQKLWDLYYGKYHTFAKLAQQIGISYKQLYYPMHDKGKKCSRRTYNLITRFVEKQK